MTDPFDPDEPGKVARLFPLPGVVLFPHAVLPLHIFEPRYRQMTEDALAADGHVAIVGLREADDMDPGSKPAIEEVACLGRIVGHERLADGRYNFLLLGVARIRLVREVDAGTLYRQAEFELIDDEGPGPGVAGRRQAVSDLFLAVAEDEGYLDPDLAALLKSDIDLGPLTDIIAHTLRLPSGVKQALLTDPRVDHRADGLIAILRELRARAPQADRPIHRYPPPLSMN